MITKLQNADRSHAEAGGGREVNGEHVRATNEAVNVPGLGLDREELGDAHFVS